MQLVLISMMRKQGWLLQFRNFIDPNGQPLSVDEVTQIYDMFQQQVAAQQGGAAEGAAAADPANRNESAHWLA